MPAGALALDEIARPEILEPGFVERSDDVAPCSLFVRIENGQSQDLVKMLRCEDRDQPYLQALLQDRHTQLLQLFGERNQASM